MKYELTNEDGIECSFILENDEVVTCFMPTSKIIELIEEAAYETITQPICNSSSCAVNNFCECDPINEDAHLQHISICVSQGKDICDHSKELGVTCKGNVYCTDCGKKLT